MPQNKLYRLIPAALYTLVIALLSLLPSKDIQGISWFNIPYFDKLVHFGLYFLLAILLLMGIYNAEKPAFRICFLVFILTMFYGGILEILQFLMHMGRSADWFDFSADCAGSLVGILLYFPARKLYDSYIKKNPAIHP